MEPGPAVEKKDDPIGTAIQEVIANNAKKAAEKLWEATAGPPYEAADQLPVLHLAAHRMVSALRFVSLWKAMWAIRS